MEKTFIGIDFSIQSPAVCVLQNKKYEFFAFPRGITKVMKGTLEIANLNLYVVPKHKKKFKTIDERERYNSIDAEIITSKIVEVLNSKKYMNENTIIGIEGIAFMARGNSVAQFSGYHYLLRKEISKFVPYTNIYVFSPSTIKKFAGKGNFKKEDMINAFINSNNNILQKNTFFNTIKTKPELFRTEKFFKKPVDDIIDSYFTLEVIKNKVNNCN